ncbi:MAG TPA: hypothetical protein VH063_09930 [Gaiellaceae bacterium]|jgi:hypothetical protein|nr:hypothetical protein [Gaiellaceae bacterium]
MTSSRRNVALLTLAVSLVAALTVGTGNSSAKLKPKKVSALAGTWSGHYSGGYSGTFTLHWTQTGSKLAGTIKLSLPHGTYTVTGSVNGSAIKFGAVGAGATYTGSVSGKSMSGSYRALPSGGSWSATKTS